MMLIVCFDGLITSSAVNKCFIDKSVLFVEYFFYYYNNGGYATLLYFPSIFFAASLYIIMYKVLYLPCKVSEKHFF